MPAPPLLVGGCVGVGVVLSDGGVLLPAGGVALSLVPGAGIEALLVALEAGSLGLAVPSTGVWSVPAVGVVLGVVVPGAAEPVSPVGVVAGSVTVPPVLVVESELEESVAPELVALPPYVLAAP